VRGELATVRLAKCRTVSEPEHERIKFLVGFMAEGWLPDSVMKRE